MDQTTPKSTELKPWVEPEISTLAIEETEVFAGPGRDGGGYPSSQRS